NTAPRSRQPDRETTTNEQKGFFQTLQEAFDEEFNNSEQQTRTESKPSPREPSRSREMASNSRPERQASERPVRETIQTARERANSSLNMSDIEKRITVCSNHVKRALEAIENVYSKVFHERTEHTAVLGRVIADEVRYSYD